MLALITGRDVHDAGTLNELLLAAMTQPAPPLASIAPGVPPQIAAIVDSALMFDKAQRWPTAAAMRDAVRAAYHALAGHPVTAAPSLASPVASRVNVDPHEPTFAAVSTGGPAKSSVDPWSGPAVPAAPAPPITAQGVTHATGFPGRAPRSGLGVGAPVLIAGAALLVILGIAVGVWTLVAGKGAAPAASAVALPDGSATEARPASSGSATAPPNAPVPTVPAVAPGASATAEATPAASAATASPTAVVTRRRTATPTVKHKPPPPQPSGKGSILDKRTR